MRQFRDLKSIVNDARHHHTRLRLIVKRKGQALKVAEGISAHIHLDTHAHHMAVILDKIPQESLKNIEKKQNGGPRQKKPHVSLGHIDIDHVPCDHREKHIAHGNEQRTRHIGEE